MKLVETEYDGEVLRQSLNSVEDGESSESQAQSFYEYFGYNVENLGPYSSLEELIEDKYLSIHNLDDNIVKKGVPDLIVYNEEEVFFVEVKKGNNGLNYTQLRWNYEYDYKTRVLWVMPEGFDYRESVEKPDYQKRVKRETVKNRVIDILELNKEKSKEDLLSDSIIAQRKDILDDILRNLIKEKKIVAKEDQYSNSLKFRSLFSESYRKEEGTHSRSELLGKVEIVYEELGKPEKYTVWQFQENTSHNNMTISKYFGSWKRAKLLAGLENPKVPKTLEKQ